MEDDKINQNRWSAVFPKVAWVAILVTLLSGYKLSLVAYETGNWHGMLFSLAHVIIVAIGTNLSLKAWR